MSASRSDDHWAPKLRARGRVDLLGIIPYLLGFHPNPHGDLVVLGLAHKRLVMHARPGIDVPPNAAATIAQLLITDPSVDQAIVVGYGPAQHRPTITAMAGALTDAGLFVREALRVNDGRYFCLLCDDCVPPGGTPFDPTTTVAAAQATAAGLVALPDRDAAMARVAYRSDTAQSMHAALAKAAVRLRNGEPDLAAGTAILDDLLRQTEAGRRVDDDAAATMILLLQRPTWLERVWLATNGQLWEVELWCDLARRCPPEHVVPVTCLAAFAAWRHGDTAIAPCRSRPRLRHRSQQSPRAAAARVA